MTILELVLGLRERIGTAVEQDDKETLSNLYTTVGVLEDVSYESNHIGLSTTLVFLGDTAQHALMNVAWKAPLPSIDDIMRAITENIRIDEVDPEL